MEEKEERRSRKQEKGMKEEGLQKEKGEEVKRRGRKRKSYLGGKAHLAVLRS